MPKILIIYQSRTGNTAAMAEAVEEGVRKAGVEVVRKKIEDTNVDDLLEPEGIIIGSPTYFAATTAEVKRLIDDSIKHYKNLEGKVGAAFVSAGGLGGGGETAILDILRAFLVHGMIVPGFVSGGHYGPLSIGSPDEDRKKVCVEFGSKVADIVKKLSAKL
ncbi:MAG: flavodoxin family protein [Proteobacteria bacterium]|nr:flavodoxin family protein [Pseudomonadota bacterium]MBU1903227.1 flavodoxin family protein [Pseudomonadota bacterium]